MATSIAGVEPSGAAGTLIVSLKFLKVILMVPSAPLPAAAIAVFDVMVPMV